MVISDSDTDKDERQIELGRGQNEDLWQKYAFPTIGVNTY